MLMATVAWFLLLMVAAFSVRAARRRVAYETWYYAHLYTYLAIALAFSHQFANGGAFARELPVPGRLVGHVRDGRRAAALVPGHHTAAQVCQAPASPCRRSGPRRPASCRCSSPAANSTDLRAEPGQFFRWRFLTRELWWQSHPYSLSAMPQPDLMRITVKARGDHSGSLANLRPGTRIIAEGPYGAFTPSLTGRRVLLIAGGVGITPIRAMFAALPKRMSGGITLALPGQPPP